MNSNNIDTQIFGKTINQSNIKRNSLMIRISYAQHKVANTSNDYAYHNMSLTIQYIWILLYLISKYKYMYMVKCYIEQRRFNQDGHCQFAHMVVPNDYKLIFSWQRMVHVATLNA